MLALMAACRPDHPPVSSDAGADTGVQDAGLHADWSVARHMDEVLLDGIRRDLPRPPVHARNLYHASAAMFDAWAVYDPAADGIYFREKHVDLASDAARNESVAYAGYRLIRARYQNAIGAALTIGELDTVFAGLGYDASNIDTTGDSPAAIGNRAAAAVIAATYADGANEAGNYADPTYVSVNAPLILTLAGDNTMTDPNRWQPLALDYSVSQNGIPLPSGVQGFVGARWGSVAPFALTRVDTSMPYIDPGPPPQVGSQQLVDEVVQVISFQSYLDPADSATIDLSPSARGNNPLGTNAGTGHATNPVTGQAYPPNVVPRADYGRAIAEFWADGPNSETPPGHWNVLANGASDHPAATHRIGGTGPVLPRLEWDVKMYLAMNGALHDAAIAAWGLKRVYDSARPISLIRMMATLGQSSDSVAASYDPGGLPLIPGLIELITPASCAAGQRHESLAAYVGEVAVRAWPGQPSDPLTQTSGIHWIRAKSWVTYQRNTFVTPPFPGFISGHSTFSRSAAEVLAAMTGDPFFPGGELVMQRDPGAFFHEYGPTARFLLEWATYFDAADEAGISRLWGGIHISADDLHGRQTGHTVGVTAWSKAQTYFDGSAVP